VRFRNELRQRAVVRLVLIASLSMVAGLFIYAADRAPGSVYLFPDALSLNSGEGLIFGALGAYLPTFIHVYTFTLLTYACLSCDRAAVITTCGFWFIIDSLLELCQQEVVATGIITIVPQWFDSIPVLENVSPYFVKGTFDPVDLLSIAVGSITAYFTINTFKEEGK